MAGQERLTETYKPEEDPDYTFTLIDTDGQETLVKYYEYDANFYAAVVENRVYLVNKMNVRDMEESYEEMIGADENSDTESAAEDGDGKEDGETAEETEKSSQSNENSDTEKTDKEMTNQ